jgi:hypothetical protein
MRFGRAVDRDDDPGDCWLMLACRSDANADEDVDNMKKARKKKEVAPQRGQTCPWHWFYNTTDEAPMMLKEKKTLHAEEESQEKDQYAESARQRRLSVKNKLDSELSSYASRRQASEIVEALASSLQSRRGVLGGPGRGGFG